MFISNWMKRKKFKTFHLRDRLCNPNGIRSIMTDLVRGKEEKDVKEIVKDFLEMIKEKDQLNNKILEENEKTKLMCLSGVKKYPMREKCATYLCIH